MSIVLEDVLESRPRPRPRTLLLRMVAFLGGLLLIWMAAVGWLVSSQILRALH